MRDDAEGNLNSLHFPEFTSGDEDGEREAALEKAKGLLMEVAGLGRVIMQVC